MALISVPCDHIIDPGSTAAAEVLSSHINAKGHCGFAGSKIMVRCMGAKSCEVELKHTFIARQWYHVALTFSSGSALTPGWARLYVNGVLEASERFKYPKVATVAA